MARIPAHSSAGRGANPSCTGGGSLVAHVMGHQTYHPPANEGRAGGGLQVAALGAILHFVWGRALSGHCGQVGWWMAHIPNAPFDFAEPAHAPPHSLTQRESPPAGGGAGEWVVHTHNNSGLIERGSE